jgi:hypothetical protein
MNKLLNDIKNDKLIRILKVIEDRRKEQKRIDEERWCRCKTCESYIREELAEVEEKIYDICNEPVSEYDKENK